MPLKPRYCIIRALGCEGKFQPKRFWHRVCKNPECQKENMRRTSRRWRKDNPEYHKKYNDEYKKI